MPSRSIQLLARQVLTIEAASQRANEAHVHEVVRACEKLKISLTRFAGGDGCTSLLRRSIALARADVPALNCISLKPDCSIDGFEALSANDARIAVEAGAAIIEQLLGLLVAFIGEPLTLRLVRESWPDVSLDESH